MNWILLLSTAVSLACAAWFSAYQSSYSQPASVLAATIAGGCISALASLFVGAVMELRLRLLEILREVVSWDSRSNVALSHRLKIEIEGLERLGYCRNDSLMAALRGVPEEVKRGCDHGIPADRVYRLLESSLAKPVLKTMFFPKYP